MILKRITKLFLSLFFIGLLAILPSVRAINDSVSLTSVVSEDPVDWTPEVPGTFNDGTQSALNEVRTYAPLNETMYAGGVIPEVTWGGASYARGNIFAFNASTGEVNQQFAPIFDGAVNAIVPSSDGQWLFVGGEFKYLNGQKLATPFIAKISSTSGELDPTFNAPLLNGKVNDLDLVRGRVIIGGKFTTVNGVTRVGLISANAVTGQHDEYINVQIARAINETSPIGVARFAVNPQKTRMAVAGSFKKIDGASRLQMFILNLDKDGDALANWDAPILHDEKCSQKPQGNAVVIEDLDFNTEGTKLFVATGGGPLSGICDAAVKFDVTLRGVNIKPDWVSKTSGDTLRSIEWTNSAVYVAGHQRLLKKSQGVYVSRPGIGALDPKTGLVLSWNPGKGREIGSKELIVTNNYNQPGMPTGLWVGSDSGNCGYLAGEVLPHQGICFFPVKQ